LDATQAAIYNVTHILVKYTCLRPVTCAHYGGPAGGVVHKAVPFLVSIHAIIVVVQVHVVPLQLHEDGESFFSADAWDAIGNRKRSHTGPSSNAHAGPGEGADGGR